MDTTAYLTRQGWRGDGHALHPSGHGIKKPLLVSKRINRLGVGKKAHDAHADQWWSRAFDETLRSINGEQSAKENTKVNASTATLTGIYATRWNGNDGLYGNFVRGEGLKGTINAKEMTTESSNRKNRSMEKRRLKKSAWSGNNDGKKSSEQVSKPHNAGLQTQKHSAKPNEVSSREEALAAFISQKVSASESILPQQEAAKSRISRGRVMPDGPSRFLNASSERAEGEGKFGGMKGDAAPSEANVAGREIAPHNDNGATQRIRKKYRRRKEEDLKTAVTANNLGSKSRFEQRVKRKKKKQRKDYN
ncbi:MAG: hypothetical protein Q9225_001298 [Loekoesia sp. 1 TL-2023]